MRIYMQIPPEGDKAPRFYHLHLQEDLLEGWSLIREWGYQGARGRVDKEMVTGAERRVGRLRLQLDLPALPPEARSVLERAAHACPVHRSLHPEVAVEIGFAWAETAAAQPRP